MRLQPPAWDFPAGCRRDADALARRQVSSQTISPGRWCESAERNLGGGAVGELSPPTPSPKKWLLGMRVLEELGAWGASPRPVVHIPGTARGPAAAVSVWCWGQGNPARGTSRRPWDQWQWGSSGTVGCAWRGRALPWGGSALGDLAGDASPLPGLYGSSRGIFPEQALPAAAQMNQVIATWKYFVLIKRRARKRCSSTRAGTDEGVPGAYGDRNPADLRLQSRAGDGQLGARARDHPCAWGLDGGSPL